MDIENIKIRIKDKYLEYLTEEEINALEESKDELVIRNLVNQIWDRYLTNPFDYEEGKAFRFLTKKGTLISIENPDFEESPIFYDTTHYLTIISNDNPSSLLLSRVETLVKVDWMKTKEVLLPDDLIDNDKYVQGKLKILGLYGINIGEGIVDGESSCFLHIADEYDLLFLNINRTKYIQNYHLRQSDKRDIVVGTISYYLVNNNLPLNFKLLRSFESKYAKYILKRFMYLFKIGEYNDREFVQEMTDYINNMENIIKREL